MAIEIVFNETFESVEQAVREAIAEGGFKVVPTDISHADIKAKMAFWTGKKGNELLATWLPFLFKVDSISAIISAYQDGTTAVQIREAGSFGGNIASGIVGNTMPLGVGTAVAYGADQASKQATLSKLLSGVDAKLREKLGDKIAHEGPPLPDAQQVLI